MLEAWEDLPVADVGAFITFLKQTKSFVHTDWLSLFSQQGLGNQFSSELGEMKW